MDSIKIIFLQLVLVEKKQEEKVTVERAVRQNVWEKNMCQNVDSSKKYSNRNFSIIDLIVLKKRILQQSWSLEKMSLSR